MLDRALGSTYSGLANSVASAKDVTLSVIGFKDGSFSGSQLVGGLMGLAAAGFIVMGAVRLGSQTYIGNLPPIRKLEKTYISIVTGRPISALNPDQLAAKRDAFAPLLGTNVETTRPAQFRRYDNATEGVFKMMKMKTKSYVMLGALIGFWFVGRRTGGNYSSTAIKTAFQGGISAVDVLAQGASAVATLSNKVPVIGSSILAPAAAGAYGVLVGWSN